MGGVAGVVPLRAWAAQRPGEPDTGIVLDRASGAYHVHPGSSIQDALDRAARDATHKRVLVHGGTYAPQARAQALIWFNARHDGITLEAVGDVTLTASNAALSKPGAPGHPAIVNHVVYFGDGITRRTALRGFRITGANNFTTGTGQRSPIESNDVRKTTFFYTDGGGIKIYARSSPTIEHVEVVENYASPCGGGVSVEHLGAPAEDVLFRNCIFRGNRTQTTGSAVDLLHGSRATLDNCLFVGNIANIGVDVVGLLTGGEFHPEHGSGALTVFGGARAVVRRCTFTDNWNGVDDEGEGSVYEDSIFWRNVRAGGISTGNRYEMDIVSAAGVRGNFLSGEIDDLRGTVNNTTNTLAAPDPMFDDRYVPRAPQYARVGYRPVTFSPSAP